MNYGSPRSYARATKANDFGLNPRLRPTRVTGRIGAELIAAFHHIGIDAVEPRSSFETRKCRLSDTCSPPTIRGEF
jgi:hypothetical protein